MNKLPLFFKDKLKTTSLIISLIVIVAAMAELYHPVTYTGNVLPGQVGSIEGTNKVAGEGKDKPGFLTYGPYAHLEPGKYNIQLEYGATSAESGSWDIIFTGAAHWINNETLPLKENGLRSHKITISKEDAGKALEIRTLYTGKGTLKVSKILIIKRFTTMAILVRLFIGGLIGFLFYFVKGKLKKSITQLVFKHPLDRGDKIKLCSLIICVGFISSMSFHYVRECLYPQVYPRMIQTPFLFCDFYQTCASWLKMQFNGIGLDFAYFPGTYLIVNIFTKFNSRGIAVIYYLLIFVVFFFIYSYVNLKTNKKMESLQNILIFSFLTYPFLFAITVANYEIFVFIFLCLFVILYSRGNIRPSLLFLAMCISMKLFPAVFLILLISDKKYKEILYTLLFVLLFTFIPLVIFDGGINKGLGNYFSHLIESQKMYNNVIVIGGISLAVGHSILTCIRILASNSFPPMQSVMGLYALVAFLAFFVISMYIIFYEKTFWKKVAILVLSMDLLPYASTDYKLLHLFIPLFLFINYSKKDKFDLIFSILFSLILIQKDYFCFNNSLGETFNCVANPVIMLAILLLIMFSGIKTNLIKNQPVQE